MNKTQLIAAAARDSSQTKASAEKVVNTLIASITKSLKKGEKVSIPGFVNISKNKRPARKGRNPRTGAEIKIPAKNVAKFKVGKTLEDALN